MTKVRAKAGVSSARTSSQTIPTHVLRSCPAPVAHAVASVTPRWCGTLMFCQVGSAGAVVPAAAAAAAAAAMHPNARVFAAAATTAREKAIWCALLRNRRAHAFLFGVPRRLY
jgi:hypothetical protein